MFRMDELRDDVKEPFVGLVVEINYPCNCALCERGNERLAEMGRELRTTNRVHVVIKPLEKYEKLQHAWYNESKLKWSAFGAFVIALNAKLAFTPKSKEPEKQFKEIKKFMEGHAFEWMPVKPVEFVSETLEMPIPRNLPSNVKDARDTWIPIRIVNDKELQNYGITDIKTTWKEAKKEWEKTLSEIEAGESPYEDDIAEFTF